MEKSADSLAFSHSALSSHSSRTPWPPSQPSKNTTEMGTHCFVHPQRIYSVSRSMKFILVLCFPHGGNSRFSQRHRLINSHVDLSSHSRLNLQIECKRVTALNPLSVEWAFELTRANMQTL